MSANSSAGYHCGIHYLAARRTISPGGAANSNRRREAFEVEEQTGHPGGDGNIHHLVASQRGLSSRAAAILRWEACH